MAGMLCSTRYWSTKAFKTGIAFADPLSGVLGLILRRHG